MRPALVIVATELLNLEAGIGDVEEPVRRETLIAEAAVKAFDVRILYGLPRADEDQLDAVSVGPDVECARDELWP